MNKSMRFAYKLITRAHSESKGRNDLRFLSLDDFLTRTKSKTLVFFGEYHSEPRIIELQQLVQGVLTTEVKQSRSREPNVKSMLHVITEHFSFEMQNLLNNFQMNDSFSFSDLKREYIKQGTEGHDLNPYREFFEYAKSENQYIRLHGGFVPRPYASRYVKTESPQELKELTEELLNKEYISRSMIQDGILNLQGSDSHYNMFESMVTGRDPYNVSDGEPNAKYRKLFEAQLLKDYAMGWYITKMMKNVNRHGTSTSAANPLSETPTNDKYLVIAGKGHLQHYLGVPEILPISSLVWMDKTMLLSPMMMWEVEIDEDNESDIKDDQKLERVILGNDLVRKSMLVNDNLDQDSYSGKHFANPIGDVLYIYDERDYDLENQ